MRNPLGTLAILALLGGGFAVTGDLGRLAGHGMRLLKSTSVPSEIAKPVRPAAAASEPAASPPQPAPPAHVIDDEAPIPVPAAAAPAAQPPRMPAQGVGPAAVDLASLPAGTRVLVWLPAEAGRPGWHRCLAIDVVAPQAGEALLHREVTVAPGQGRSRTADAPARVTIRAAGADGLFGTTAASGRLIVGGMFDCTLIGLAHAASNDRAARLGPIAALAIER